MGRTAVSRFERPARGAQTSDRGTEGRNVAAADLPAVAMGISGSSVARTVAALGGALDSVKGMFGIHSPSKKMKDERLRK